MGWISAPQGWYITYPGQVIRPAFSQRRFFFYVLKNLPLLRELVKDKICALVMWESRFFKTRHRVKILFFMWVPKKYVRIFFLSCTFTFFFAFSMKKVYRKWVIWNILTLNNCYFLTSVGSFKRFKFQNLNFLRPLGW